MQCSRLQAKRAVALLTIVVMALTGCAGGGDEADPRELLVQAKRQFDKASSARFALTSSDVPDGAAALVAGTGVLGRPDKFRGELEVSIGSGTASVSIISVDGQVFAKLPFAKTYARTDPSRFGLGDPGDYMDPDKGLSTFLVKAKNPRLGARTRLGGEVVQEVKAKIPGKLIDDLLVSADPTKPVNATFSITEKKNEVRRVKLKGPFFQQGADSTLTIVLDRYGEPVTITAPTDVAAA